MTKTYIENFVNEYNYTGIIFDLRSLSGQERKLLISKLRQDEIGHLYNIEDYPSVQFFTVENCDVYEFDTCNELPGPEDGNYVVRTLKRDEQGWYIEEDKTKNGDIWVYDTECFYCDWLFSAKRNGEYVDIWNDPGAVEAFLADKDPILCGYNVKHYDKWIIGGILNRLSPERINAEISKGIIEEHLDGWDIEGATPPFYIPQIDLMDDTQEGLSLKMFEGHMGMNITESSVDFRIQRPLTDEEKAETVRYCHADIDATEKLMELRSDYLNTKVMLAREKGLDEEQVLGMTNAQLTAAYLGATPKRWNDERDYVYPDNLKREYIPSEVFAFFDRLHDKSISDEDLFTSKLKIWVGECEVTIGFGGIHGAIPTYEEREQGTRLIRNKDVASYYPHLMTINGYTSRNIDDPQAYADVLERRIQAKASGNKPLASALKLIVNTTYGGTLAKYNSLYDPKNARSVCISGQLYLLELTEHLLAECRTLKPININTDGVMFSYDQAEDSKVQEICREWQERTGFTLEEDKVARIIQKDVSNYIEIAEDGERKLKGGVLVRGIQTAGAFSINNNMTVVAEAVINYLVDGIPPEETIYAEQDILKFQMIAKASSKFGQVYHRVGGFDIPVQRCNRVYASRDINDGTLYKTNLRTGNLDKIAGLPPNLLCDNDSSLGVEDIDREWYCRLARSQARDFKALRKHKRNTRRVNLIKKAIMEVLNGEKNTLTAMANRPET